MTNHESISVSRVIDASAKDIYEFLTLPRNHVTMDGSGMVRGAVNGDQRLGWYDGGDIAPGRLADFVVINPNTPRTVGAKAAELLYAATAADIDTVVVGGRTVVADGHHMLGPVAPLLRSALLGLRGH